MSLSSDEHWVESNHPYRHWICEKALDAPQAAEISSWLLTGALWHRSSRSFYDQFECRNALAVGSPLRKLTTQRRQILELTQRLAGVALHDEMHVGAHLLLPGQAIGVHTDLPGNRRETHRIVVMVPSPVPPDGGGFVLSETRDAEGSVGYEHTGGAAVLMPLGDASFHAVGRVHRGIRLSLILSFWAQTQTDLDVPSPATSDSPGTSPATLPAIRMLTELGASKAHSGASLLAHLFGTHEILRRWGQDEDTCLAGLFHSVYGTADYQEALLAEPDRDLVRSLVGDEAERLAWRYSSLDKAAFRAALCNGSPVSKELARLAAIDLANELEQAGRLGFTDEDADYCRRVSSMLNLSSTEFAAVRWARLRERSLTLISKEPAAEVLTELATVFSDQKVSMATADAGPFTVRVSQRSLRDSRNDALLKGSEELPWFPRIPPMTACGKHRVGHPQSYIMLAHTSALWAWSLHASAALHSTLVHVDAHDDIGELPTTIDQSGTMTCPVSARAYSLSRSADVHQAIAHGVVSIGNFVTAALAAGWFAELVYANEHSPRRGPGRVDVCIEQRPSPLGPRRVIKSYWKTVGSAKAEGCFRSVPAIGIALQDLDSTVAGRTSCFLDVDLDFACSHHDDSAACPWPVCTGDAIARRIGAVKNVSERHRNRIVVETWALSPDFFPSEHWGNILSGTPIDWM